MMHIYCPDYQRDTVLPRRLHTSANGPIRVILASTEIKTKFIINCQLLNQCLWIDGLW